MKNETTLILRRLAAGEENALDELVPRVYDELRQIARQQLVGESNRDLLQTTVLVHEAYLRLIDQTKAEFQDRSHFMAVASTVMRRVLLDHFRGQMAAKRGGGHSPITLRTSHEIRITKDPLDLLAFDEVLTRLENLNERHAKIVELRFFGGLTIEETAAALGVSEATVKNDWRAARAWLAVEMDI